MHNFQGFKVEKIFYRPPPMYARVTRGERRDSNWEIGNGKLWRKSRRTELGLERTPTMLRGSNHAVKSMLRAISKVIGRPGLIGFDFLPR